MKEYNLINNSFNKKDAKELLYTLYSDKINYHNNKIFSLTERFGCDCSDINKKIDDLKTTKERLLKDLELIDSDKFEIEAVIKITPKYE